MIKLITTKEAAQILGLSEKTIHNRKAGTTLLKRVYFGKSVRLVRSEVEAFRDLAIEKAGRIVELKRV